MKKYNVLLSLLLFTIFIMPINAKVERNKENRGATEEGTAIVSYEANENEKYPLKVVVQKGGALYDGKQTIRNGTNIYELALGTSKKFKIIEDKGYELSHVWLQRPQIKDTKEITNQVQNDEFTVSAESTEMVVIVDFKKSKPGYSSNGTVTTGDSSLREVYETFIFLALLTMLLLLNSKRERAFKKGSYDMH